MSDPTRNADLSDAPGTDADEREELEQETEEAEQQSESFVHENADLASAITNVVQDLQVSTFNSDGLNLAQDSVPQVATEAVAPSSPALDERVNKLTALKTKLANDAQATKDFNTKRFLARFFGITITTSATLAAVFECVSRFAHAKPADDVPLSDATKQNIQALVQAWQNMSDSDYWKDLAQYVASNQGTNKLTIADQIYFMDYTIQCSNDPETWIWNSADDKVAIADKLSQQCQATNTSPMYTLVPNISYQPVGQIAPVPLPRPVAADVLRLALAWIIPS